MNDKERLENMSPLGFDLNGNILLKSEDYHWLMEQAERYEDLLEQVKQIEKVSDYNADLLMKYEKALEFYAERDNYQWEVSYRPQQEIDCMVIDDSGHTARKALDGTK
ncbi:hypothetical protein [Caldifermentibacillus hisashii]|uniref:hypothetical protein n=1 Tax=Caldifermentibacillus hisashii TaxID=996558 RepID=UPI0030EAB65C